MGDVTKYNTFVENVCWISRKTRKKTRSIQISGRAVACEVGEDGVTIDEVK